MTAKLDSYLISPQDYLEGETVSPIKHEYVRGRVYAMGGASDAHVTIAGNLFTLLKPHLRGTGCRVYIADMKVHVRPADVYYYPDVVVTCDKRDKGASYFKQYPCLIAEVLSPRTEAFDRGDKFADYQQLETLQEYLLIAQERLEVECLRRTSAGRWEWHAFGQSDEVYLASVDFRCPVAALYEDVSLTSEGQPV